MENASIDVILCCQDALLASVCATIWCPYERRPTVWPVGIEFECLASDYADGQRPAPDGRASMRILVLGEAKRHERFACLFAPVDTSDGDTLVLEVLLLNVVFEFGQIGVVQLPHHLIRVETVQVECSFDGEVIGVFLLSRTVSGAVECGVWVDVMRAVLGGELPGFSFQLLVHCLLAAAHQCEQRCKSGGNECLASHLNI